MKMKIYTIIISSLLMTGCATNKPYILPPLKYDGPVVHIQKNADIYWRHGIELEGKRFTGQSGDLIVDIIQAQDRKNNPSKYRITYGKAEQASFITSFRDVLKQNHIFKDIAIITNPAEAKPGAVIVEINFKTTRVSGFEHNYKITLTVEMKITSGKETFTRTYMSESDEGTFFSAKSFDEQMVYVSEEMVAKLIGGIKQWSKS